MFLKELNKKRRGWDLDPIRPEPKYIYRPPILTPAQQVIYDDVMKTKQFYYVLVGGLGSGKTFLNCRIFLERVLNDPNPNAVYGIAGSSHTAIQNVIIKTIMQQTGQEVVVSQRTSSFKLFGKTVILMACGQKNDHKNWLGGNLSGVWGTEAVEWLEDNYDKLLGRVRVGDSCIMLDTNPSTPNHWLKQKIDLPKDDAAYLKDYNLHPTANPHIDEKSKARMSANYVGNARERWIEGQWVGLESAPFGSLIMCSDYTIKKTGSGSKVVMFIDLAYSTNKGADSTSVSIVWPKTKGDTQSSLDSFFVYGENLKEGWNNPNNINRVINLITQYGVTEVWIENNSNHLAVEYYKNEFANTPILQRSPLKIIGVRNSKNKSQRIANLGLYVAYDKLHIIDKTQREYFEELVSFEYDNKTQHDDAPDSLESAIRAYVTGKAEDFEKGFFEERENYGYNQFYKR